MPNAWDAGSAKVLASLGFEALATTSSGHAATLGRLDGGVSREEAVEHATALAAAVDVPVSADFENGFADEPAGVADTVGMALVAGLAGCSVEDYTGDDGNPIYDRPWPPSAWRPRPSGAHAGNVHLVLTARAENLIRGRDDLEDTIARLVAYEEAGADVLFAPGLATDQQIRAVIEAVRLPLNVLARPGLPRSPSWPSSASPACRSAARSRLLRSQPSSRQPRSSANAARTGSGSARRWAPGPRAPRSHSRAGRVRGPALPTVSASPGQS